MGGSSGLTVELELADLTDSIVNHGTNSTWGQLENMQINIDSVTLTSEMTNNFADMLIRGESIMISYSTCDSQKLYLNGGAHQVLSVAKQFSRLASVSVSFADTIGNPSADNAVGCNEKEINKFYLASGSAELVESNIQVNNMRWPNFNNLGVKQHFCRLLQGLGIWNSVSHSCNISEIGYGSGEQDSRQFLMFFDLESEATTSSSGVPVQGGGTIQITALNLGSPTTAFVNCYHDCVLEIRSQGSIAYS